MSGKKDTNRADSINHAIMGICESLDLNRSELISILKVCPNSFFNIYKTEKFTEDETRKALIFINLYVEISRLIPFSKNQKEWIRTPNKRLNDRTPINILTAENDGINIVLEALKEGI